MKRHQASKFAVVCAQMHKAVAKLGRQLTARTGVQTVRAANLPQQFSADDIMW